MTNTTIVETGWCSAMSPMPTMPMPGGWSMSMAWMRMPGQTWAAAAIAFVGMWSVMMLAMMLPSLAPMLWRYRETVARAGAIRPGRLVACVTTGYFIVWIGAGITIYPLGVALAMLTMQQPALSRAVPLAVGLVALMAGAFQFTNWKLRHLACCRVTPGCGVVTVPASAATAWRDGLRLGDHCLRCCAGLMAVLLCVGVMDVRAMALVTVAITLERVTPAAESTARALGTLLVATALLQISAALG